MFLSQSATIILREGFEIVSVGNAPRADHKRTLVMFAVDILERGEEFAGRLARVRLAPGPSFWRPA